MCSFHRRPPSRRAALIQRLQIVGLATLLLPGVISAAEDYFPPPESQGGWRVLTNATDLRQLAGVDPVKLGELREWLLQSDQRNFAAVVVRRGYVVLEVERGNSAKTDARRVASVSKAICSTVLAVASELSQQGKTPRRMKFDDPAFDFLPWAQPLSDPRKARITVKQLLNHTSGICPEATGAANDGSWEYILGHTGNPHTQRLAFEPGTGCGYSTHALHHAALVCETVTGMPYEQFAISNLFTPLGIEHWWFQYYDGASNIGRHASHGLGLPARDLARVAYCMLREGRWRERQLVPRWFVDETAAPTHSVRGPEMRFKLNAQSFSHAWELPARLTGEGGRSGEGIPWDARHKPGSGGQSIAFIPSLDLALARQTGSSGEWAYEEYLRRACRVIVAEVPPARTSLSLTNAPFTRPENGYVVLRRGPLEAVLVDNRGVNDAVLAQHRPGYHGVAALRHEKEPRDRNLFVPAYAGLNFEHIHDGTTQARDVLFEPRRAPMELRAIDEHTVELYQPPTPFWGLESCARYELRDDASLELTFECIPRRATWKNGYLGLFWASYIAQPGSLEIHFRGRPDERPDVPPDWVRGVSPAHGQLSTHAAWDDPRELVHDSDFPLSLVFNRSRFRYAEPWYFGLSHGLAFAQVFRPSDHVRLSQSPDGGGVGNPAWDFQWIIEQPEVGRRYQLVMRASYRPFEGPEAMRKICAALRP
jgi:CubicO group peptidase (beta-lactamase class C family)